MPQTQLYRRRAFVYVTPEDTVDTYKPPSADEGFIAFIPEAFDTLDSANWEPDYIRGDFVRSDEVPGTRARTLTFQVPIKGSGLLGKPPRWAKALGLAGCAEEIDDGASVKYWLSSNFGANQDIGPPIINYPAQSYSVTIIEDGVIWAVKGAFSNLVFTGEVGVPSMLEFNPTGAYVDLSDGALIEPDACDPTTAQPFMGASLAIDDFGGSTPFIPKAVETLNLDAGNMIAVGRDVNEASGVYGSRITSHKLTGTFDPEMTTVAVYDWHKKWRDGTALKLTTGEVGLTAGNKWQIDIARMIFRPPEQGNRDDKRIITQGFAASGECDKREADGQEFLLTFT